MNRILFLLTSLTLYLGADDYYNKTGKYHGWKYIVIHHSATSAGSAKSFHDYHTKQGWGGLAYHFVIGNGKGDADGEIQQGFRWKEQITGTHCSVNSWEYNIHGIGICMVGDLSKTNLSAKQKSSLERLTAGLAYSNNISVENIIRHDQVTFDDGSGKTETTACPGKFDIKTFRKKISVLVNNNFNN